MQPLAGKNPSMQFDQPGIRRGAVELELALMQRLQGRGTSRLDALNIADLRQDMDGDLDLCIRKPQVQVAHRPAGVVGVDRVGQDCTLEKHRHDAMRGQGLKHGGQLTGAQRRTRRSEVIGVLQLGQDGGRDGRLELILAQAVENEGRHPLTVQPGCQGRVQPVARQPFAQRLRA